jgi:hypothetical protein
MNLLIRIFCLLVLVFCSKTTISQNLEIPFIAGEKITYDVYYNWHFVWVEAGKVSFEVEKEKINEKPVFHFKSEGRSIIAYDWIYKVREQFESVADAKTLVPLSYSRQSFEGDYYAKEIVEFDYPNSKIHTKTENSNKPLSSQTLDLNGFVLDVQTAVYYARTLDYSGMFVGEKIPFRMVIDGEVCDLYGKYLGVETIENYDGSIYRCHKFAALLVPGTIFSGGEDLFVWITDDRNKIPILVEAKILVGSVKAVFTGAKNLAFPITSLVK